MIGFQAVRRVLQDLRVARNTSRSPLPRSALLTVRALAPIRLMPLLEPGVLSSVFVSPRPWHRERPRPITMMVSEDGAPHHHFGACLAQASRPGPWSPHKAAIVDRADRGSHPRAFVSTSRRHAAPLSTRTTRPARSTIAAL